MTPHAVRHQRTDAMRTLRRTRRYLCRNCILFLVFILFSAEILYIHLYSSRITLTDMDTAAFCSQLRIAGTDSPVVIKVETSTTSNQSKETVTASPVTQPLVTTPNTEPPLTVERLTSLDNDVTRGNGEFKECRKVAGIQRSYRSQLSIGIPTVQREGYSYLTETLNSIIENSSDEQKAVTVVVIFLADSDFDFRANTVTLIATNYMPHIDAGFIQIVEPPFEAYPNFQNMERNYNDSEARVKWRSKQVVDFAYLFMYCKDLSKYYLNLEDDVITKPDFIAAINLFIEQQTQKWVILDFSTLGFIGKLIKADDLEQFAKFLMLFYSEQPVDYMLSYFRSLHLQKKAIVRIPTLFQHIGEHSSLAQKIQKLKDPNFAAQPAQPAQAVTHIHEYNGDNPAAMISTNMPQYQQHIPENAYIENSTSVFWSSREGRAGDYFIIQFKRSVVLNRVVIETGVAGHVNDSIHSGTLYASQDVLALPPEGTGAQNATASSLSLVPVAPFVNGRLDVNGLESTLRSPVNYLCITISKNQTDWVIIREIAVFTKPQNIDIDKV